MILPQTADLSRIRHVALDMDGTIYSGGTLFHFTRPFLERLTRLGIGYTFLTNNSSKSVADYLAHLERIGIPADPDQLYTSTGAALDYLRAHLPNVRSLFVLGTPSLKAEFARHGFTVVEGATEPEAVVVGFDTGLDYERLCKAAWWVKHNKPYIATHPDKICPTDRPTVLVDCGAVCACIESATGRAPDVVLGKPDPSMLTGILKRHALQPSELAMVGDRLYTDIVMAHRAGATGVLVLTGEARVEDIATAAEKPDVVVPSLAELGDLLERSGESGVRK